MLTWNDRYLLRARAYQQEFDNQILSLLANRSWPNPVPLTNCELLFDARNHHHSGSLGPAIPATVGQPQTIVALKFSTDRASGSTEQPCDSANNFLIRQNAAR